MPDLQSTIPSRDHKCDTCDKLAIPNLAFCHSHLAEFMKEDWFNASMPDYQHTTFHKWEYFKEQPAKSPTRWDPWLSLPAKERRKLR